jgi:hypothetical protein
MDFHDDSYGLRHDDHYAAKSKALLLREMRGCCDDESDMTDIKWQPQVVGSFKCEFSHEYGQEGDEDERYPGNEDRLPSDEEFIEFEQIDDLTFLQVAVVEERPSQDDEAGHDHIVDRPKVIDLEHDREQRLPEDEYLLRPFLVGLVRTRGNLLLYWIGTVE